MSKPINAFKHIEMPELLSLGKGMLKYLPEIVDKVALRGKCLLVTDAFLKDKYAKEVEAIMEAEKHEIIISVIDDSTLAEVDKQLQLFKEIDAGYAIGLGGGRPIDVAKLTSFKAKKRFISIPTIASHDGLASSRASLKGVDKRHSIEARPPIAVVGDTDILDNAPYRFTVAGCGDVIAKKT
ncbi:MAG: iron-containing alcohol dehydrogenase, partial [Candidatus Heimdallarchaeota archaeon]|nr:iron-containing alcohol dehydrogenase [Candidatus Heimdallarchaeota archaeon]